MPTLSIDFTAPQSQRMAIAIGVALMLGRDATAQEVKQYWIATIQRFVKNIEYNEATKQISSQPFDPV